MKNLFHGTSMKNLSSIVNKGLFKSVEGGVYLTDSQQSALAWTFMRHNGDDILVLEVEVSQDKLILGTDHSPLMQELFGCGESYIYMDKILPNQIKNYVKFKI